MESLFIIFVGAFLLCMLWAVWIPASAGMTPHRHSEVRILHLKNLLFYVFCILFVIPEIFYRGSRPIFLNILLNSLDSRFRGNDKKETLRRWKDAPQGDGRCVILEIFYRGSRPIFLNILLKLSGFPQSLGMTWKISWNDLHCHPQLDWGSRLFLLSGFLQSLGMTWKIARNDMKNRSVWHEKSREWQKKLAEWHTLLLFGFKFFSWYNEPA